MAETSLYYRQKVLICSKKGIHFLILVRNYDLSYVLEKKLHDFEYFFFFLVIESNDSVTDMKLSLNIQSFPISKVHLIASLRDKHPHSVSMPSNHPTIQSPDKCI